MVRVRARVMITSRDHGESSGNRVAARGGMRGAGISQGCYRSCQGRVKVPTTGIVKEQYERYGGNSDHLSKIMIG